MNELIVKAPICFKPYLKSVLWGGSKICSYKEISQIAENIGESWEISAVPGHVSVVENGPYNGKSLTELISLFGVQLLGENVYNRYNGKFPLLIKLIDANDNLSVQVHPDDELAKKRHNSLGKTEMWYIISSEKDAKIYSGLNRQISPDEYETMVTDGTFSDVLAVHESNPGDVFYLPAGRVHAIGAGNLLAEIQESSDVTYRIFDYNRKDSFGNTRELHTGLAKNAINYTIETDYKSEPPLDSVKDAEIIDCSHFNVRRVIIDGESKLDFDPQSFTVIICIEGKISLLYGDGSTVLKRGHSALVPAVLNEIRVDGNGSMLIAHA